MHLPRRLSVSALTVRKDPCQLETEALGPRWTGSWTDMNWCLMCTQLHAIRFMVRCKGFLALIHNVPTSWQTSLCCLQRSPGNTFFLRHTQMSKRHLHFLSDHQAQGGTLLGDGSSCLPILRRLSIGIVSLLGKRA